MPDAREAAELFAKVIQEQQEKIALLERRLKILEEYLRLDQMVPVKEAAKELGVSDKTIYKWIYDGRLKHKKVGGRVMIPRRELFSMFRDAKENNH